MRGHAYRLVTDECVRERLQEGDIPTSGKQVLYCVLLQDTLLACTVFITRSPHKIMVEMLWACDPDRDSALPAKRSMLDAALLTLLCTASNHPCALRLPLHLHRLDCDTTVCMSLRTLSIRVLAIDDTRWPHPSLSLTCRRRSITFVLCIPSRASIHTYRTPSGTAARRSASCRVSYMCSSCLMICPVLFKNAGADGAKMAHTEQQTSRKGARCTKYTLPGQIARAVPTAIILLPLNKLP